MKSFNPLSGPEHIPSKEIRRAVILLHGLGSNGDDLLSFAPALSAVMPHTAFIAPHAPMRLPNMYNAFQWFDLWNRTEAEIEQGVRDAAPLLADLVAQTCKRFNLQPQNIGLVGFSQGTMMALHAGLRLINGLGAIVGFSGAMINPHTLGKDHVKNLPPVLLIHGQMDHIVPVQASQQAEVALHDIGADVRLVERPYLGHTIDPIGSQESMAFLRKHIKETA